MTGGSSHVSRHHRTGAAQAHSGQREADQAPLAAAGHLVVPGREHRRADHLRALLPVRRAAMACRRPHLPQPQARLGQPVPLPGLDRRPARHPRRVRGDTGHLVRQVTARELAQARPARPGLVRPDLADPDRGGRVPDRGRRHLADQLRPALRAARGARPPRPDNPVHMPPRLAGRHLPGRLSVAAGGDRHPGWPGGAPRVRPGRQHRPDVLHRPVGRQHKGRHRRRRGESVPAPAPLAVAAGSPRTRRLDHAIRSASAQPDPRHQARGAYPASHPHRPGHLRRLRPLRRGQGRLQPASPCTRRGSRRRWETSAWSCRQYWAPGL